MATSQWRLIVSICLLAFVSFSTKVVSAETDKPPFYQVQWQGKTAYLLGSIHIGRADFYPLPAQIETALGKARGLVVEVDINKADSTALLQQYGRADKTKGLDWQSRDKQTVQIMSRYCAATANVCQSIQSFAPWLQATQVNLMRYNTLGYSTDYGVDMQLMARHAALPVYQLETAESQFQLLASFDSQEQWSMVREAISASDADLLSLITAWRSGNETELDSIMQEQMGGEGDTQMLERILWQRNHVMADGIIKLMGSAEVAVPLFVVVGAGHVVGDKSVVQRLKQAGAKVSACWKEACE
ncbi:TraB/GumN family protein [Shewanella glacialipiscicola]|uniref:TraB/GumN family protein n=1 Tax=Shewanella glacialipiscicola TaxID=614069 RepID=UPI0021DA41E5|nr:TraB/GumN family protein [Shewanella glacialipiscicola]MCU7993811.1 TraB/GumN family protein [Shewanella glacialipiscicola]MCU8025129.1 TraB/GumN family protein [Shewanella glacialipiscicola]